MQKRGGNSLNFGLVTAQANHMDFHRKLLESGTHVDRGHDESGFKRRTRVLLVIEFNPPVPIAGTQDLAEAEKASIGSC
jgi:hypothetical protein